MFEKKPFQLFFALLSPYTIHQNFIICSTSDTVLNEPISQIIEKKFVVSNSMKMFLLLNEISNLIYIALFIKSLLYTQLFFILLPDGKTVIVSNACC